MFLFETDEYDHDPLPPPETNPPLQIKSKKIVPLLTTMETKLLILAKEQENVQKRRDDDDDDDDDDEMRMTTEQRGLVINDIETTRRNSSTPLDIPNGAIISPTQDKHTNMHFPAETRTRRKERLKHRKKRSELPPGVTTLVQPPPISSPPPSPDIATAAPAPANLPPPVPTLELTTEQASKADMLDAAVRFASRDECIRALRVNAWNLDHALSMLFDSKEVEDNFPFWSSLRISR